MRCLAFALLLCVFPKTVLALPSGSPVCDVLADYANVTGMTTRPRNFNAGPYQASIDVLGYEPGVPIDIEIFGPRFLGLMVTVVDELGNKVGTFSAATQIRTCGDAMAVTHSTRLDVTSKTLTWIPPAEPVGTVYVQAYILEGAPGAGSNQNFYRMVRQDGSALAISPDSDAIFKSRFEDSGSRASGKVRVK